MYVYVKAGEARNFNFAWLVKLLKTIESRFLGVIVVPIFFFTTATMSRCQVACPIGVDYTWFRHFWKESPRTTACKIWTNLSPTRRSRSSERSPSRLNGPRAHTARKVISFSK